LPNIKPYIQKPIYDFYSQGPKGIIHKRVFYQITSDPNVWQLIMGDYDKNLNKLDIYNVTNNNDREKILATVGVTLYSFFSKSITPWSMLKEVQELEQDFIKWELV